MNDYDTKPLYGAPKKKKCTLLQLLLLLLWIGGLPAPSLLAYEPLILRTSKPLSYQASEPLSPWASVPLSPLPLCPQASENSDPLSL